MSDTTKQIPNVECLKYHGTKDKPDIKIFVSHRIDQESVTIDNPLYIPVRCGAVYDKREDIDLIGDDTGENISEKRNSYCELTVQYWAWKNIDADYYGLCHYRRYLNLSNKMYAGDVNYHYQVLEKILTNNTAEKYGLLDKENIINDVKKYDMIVAKQWDTRNFNTPKGPTNSVYEMWEAHDNLLINKNDLPILLNTIKDIAPKYYDTAIKYFNNNLFRGFNCFIMKKEFFFHLCEFEFPILEEIEKRLDISLYGKNLSKVFGFMGEMLYSIFIQYCIEQKKFHIKETQLIYFENSKRESDIAPLITNKQCIPIVVTSSNYYVPYLGVFLKSLMDTASNDYIYDVIVLNKQITDQNKELLINFCKNFNNISIRFYNPTSRLNGFTFYTANAVEESNYRLLAPWILPLYNKAVIMDVDIILKSDIAKLYIETTFEKDEILAASKDLVYQGMLNGTVPDTKEYARNVMKMKKPYNYVNTGVMVFDFNKIRNFTTENKLLDFSGTHHFRIQEQDIINVFYEDHINFLNLRWNFYLETNSWITQCLEYAPTSESTLYEEARKNPYLLHYANVPKPWDEPESLKAEEFWKTAKETPFYEIIISRLMDSI